MPGRLRDAKGGDEARFSMLMGPLGAKLVGRGSPSDSLALMQAVLAARGIHIVEERPPVTSTISRCAHQAALTFGTPVFLLFNFGVIVIDLERCVESWNKK